MNTGIDERSASAVRSSKDASTPPARQPRGTVTAARGGTVRRRDGSLTALAVLWSALCAGLGLWWVLAPEAYPLYEADAPMGLMESVPPGVAARTVLVLGLAGTGLATLLGRTDVHTPGRRALLLAGAGYAAVFGLLVPDVQLLAFLGYATALIGPIVVVVMLAVGARRHPRNLLLLALIGGAVALGVVTGEIGGPTLDMLREIRDGVRRVGVRPAVLVVMAAGGVLFAALTVAAARRGSSQHLTPEARARLDRWGRAATWVAAASPMPYALIRLTWLTPWPQGAPGGPDAIGPGVRVFGILLGLAALGGAALTLGLIYRWGEVFPAWLPALRGRPVPVWAAVVPASIVAVVLCASAVSLVLMSTRDGASWLAAAIPAPVWGPALALATYAYYRRRTDRGALR